MRRARPTVFGLALLVAGDPAAAQPSAADPPSGAVLSVSGTCLRTPQGLEKWEAVQVGLAVRPGDRLVCRAAGRLLLRLPGSGAERPVGGAAVYEVPYAQRSRTLPAPNVGGRVAEREPPDGLAPHVAERLDLDLPSPAAQRLAEGSMAGRAGAAGLGRLGEILAAVTGRSSASAGAMAGAMAGASRTAAGRTCDEPLGTLAVVEDRTAPWFEGLREAGIDSTVPILRAMSAQSNCFVVVDADRSASGLREWTLGMRGIAGALKGRIATSDADFIVSPRVLSFGKSDGAPHAGAMAFAAPGAQGPRAVAQLELVESRSTMKVAEAVGVARQVEGAPTASGRLNAVGVPVPDGLEAAMATPEGRDIVRALADAFDQMVVSAQGPKEKAAAASSAKPEAPASSAGDAPQPASAAPASAPN